MWILDPIDGTKGFLRGEQHAVCLVLLVDTCVELRVMDCPNLPVPSGPRGCILVAVRGYGAYKLPLDKPFAEGARAKLTIPTFTQETVNFLESGAFWGDHAGGAILVEKAGGVISEGRGEPLDFGLGRTLGENYGIVASRKDVHPKVIAAIKQAKSEEGQSQI